MCTYWETHWYDGPLKSNTHTHTHTHTSEKIQYINNRRTHRGTCHIIAWRAQWQMLISRDDLDDPKLLCESFYDNSKTKLCLPPSLPPSLPLTTFQSLTRHKHKSACTPTFQTQRWTRWSLGRICAGSWAATWRVWAGRCGCPTGRCSHGWSAWCTPRRCPGSGSALCTRWNVLQRFTLIKRWSFFIKC